MGLLLLVAAVVAVARHSHPLQDAWARLAGGSWWLAACVLVLPILHVPLTGAIFRFATAPDALGRERVGLGEMTALIATANLGNYLPLRPGLIGRIAYHRSVNGISVVESAKILAGVVGSGLAAGLVLVLAGLAAARAGQAGFGPGSQAGVASVPLLVAFAGAALGGGTGRVLGRWWLVWALRYIDLAVWAARYMLGFHVLGQSLAPSQAAIYAVVGNIAMLVPIAGNGLGLREWSIGLVAPWLPAWLLAGGSASGQSIALSADLMNRAGEVLVALLTAPAGTWYLGRHVRVLAANRTPGSSVQAHGEPTPGA